MSSGLDRLLIYKMAEELELEIHEITKGFPADERFRSVDQLSRSSSSVSNNIAEAYNKRSVRDRIRILHDICRGEAEETRTNLLRCAKKGFCDAAEARRIADRYEELMKAISGFVGYLRKQELLMNVQSRTPRPPPSHSLPPRPPKAGLPPRPL
ncbi:four helix bundle protein [Candidatus Uhrbacteria bacterium]|nr:four helix bundle protein [Candidatus Uhrbacteria bacterium]